MNYRTQTGLSATALVFACTFWLSAPATAEVVQRIMPQSNTRVLGQSPVLAQQGAGVPLPVPLPPAGAGIPPVQPGFGQQPGGFPVQPGFGQQPGGFPMQPGFPGPMGPQGPVPPIRVGAGVGTHGGFPPPGQVGPCGPRPCPPQGGSSTRVSVRINIRVRSGNVGCGMRRGGNCFQGMRAACGVRRGGGGRGGCGRRCI